MRTLYRTMLPATCWLAANRTPDHPVRADVANPQKPVSKHILLLLPVLVMALVSRPAYAEDLYGLVVPSVDNPGHVIEGEAFAIDGTTITIRLHPIRLYGIQALEDDYPCTDGSIGADEATRFLSRLIAGQMVTCLVQGQDVNQRPAAICSVGNTDLNEAIVLNGLARANTFSGQAYRRTEQTAIAVGAGYHKAGGRCLPSWGHEY